jgi:proline racemase
MMVRSRLLRRRAVATYPAAKRASGAIMPTAAGRGGQRLPAAAATTTAISGCSSRGAWLQQQQQQQQHHRCSTGGRRRVFSSWGAGTRTFQVVDTHCEGEPARILLGGMPPVPGETMYEKRNYIMEHLDDVRTLLITEPRGYPCQNLDIVLPPSRAAEQEDGPPASFGFVIAEQNKIYPAMSGHNCICTATALLEGGMVPMVEPVTEFTLEAPAGLIRITARCSNGKATEITLQNQPAFVAPGGLGVQLDVPHFGPVEVDIAFGGMWYCIVDAAAMGLELVSSQGKDICRLGEMVKVAAREQFPVDHPVLDYPGALRRVLRRLSAPYLRHSFPLSPRAVCLAVPSPRSPTPPPLRVSVYTGGFADPWAAASDGRLARRASSRASI